MGKIVVSLQGDVNIGEVMKRLNGLDYENVDWFRFVSFWSCCSYYFKFKRIHFRKIKLFFIEDVQDWMNFIIESPIATDNGLISGGSSMTQIMDAFSEKS